MKQMGKKMKLPSLFKTPEEGATTSWPWPSCGTPKTLSFRAGGNMLNVMNSSFAGVADSPEKPWFTGSAEEGLDSEESAGGEESIEAVIRGLRSAERLFFQPGETSSIMEEAKSDGFPFKESVVMAMESRDPYVDFKRSMEEMVEAHGLKDWECLEELLSWFLRVNGKNNHGYIIEAFVDLLFGLAFDSSLSSFSSSSSDHDQSSSNTITSTAHSPASPLSFSSSTSSTSPCSSPLEAEDEIEKSVDN